MKELFPYKWYSVLIEWPEEDCCHCITILSCESTQQVWSIENSSYQLLILEECKLHFQDLELWEIYLHYLNILHTICLKQVIFCGLEHWNGYEPNYWGTLFYKWQIFILYYRLHYSTPVLSYTALSTSCSNSFEFSDA